MSLKHSTGLKNYALASGLRPAFDTNGRLDIYTGAQPANADAAATGTKLATINLAATAFKAAANGGIALNGPLSATVLASGTAGWFRFYLATETAPGSAAGATDKRLDGTIGSGQDMNVDNPALVSGGTVQIADGGSTTIRRSGATAWRSKSSTWPSSTTARCACMWNTTTAAGS